MRDNFEKWFKDSFKDFEKLEILQVCWDQRKQKYVLASNNLCIGPARDKQEMWLAYKAGINSVNQTKSCN